MGTGGGGQQKISCMGSKEYSGIIDVMLRASASCLAPGLYVVSGQDRRQVSRVSLAQG